MRCRFLAARVWATEIDSTKPMIETTFDMIHVVPPQTTPDFIRVSPLVDEAGWVDIDPKTLRHKTYENIWSIGDVMNAPNAKNAAAVRKQAPIVANNLLAVMNQNKSNAKNKNCRMAHYDGYGSCPLTVERGKIVLAEFGYGGVLLPSFPEWALDGKKPSRAAWFLKESMLPPIYWKAMLRGKEWMAKPEIIG
jgi:sulfide:quinone oxidoreductase